MTCAIDGCGSSGIEVEVRRIEGDDWERRLVRQGFVEVAPPTPMARMELCEEHRKWFIVTIGAKWKGAPLETGDLVWYDCAVGAR